MRQLILRLLVVVSPSHVHGDALVYNIGITLCADRCLHRSSCQSFAYNLNTLSCSLSRQEATTRKMEGYTIRSKRKQLIPEGRCSLTSCTSGSLCLENRLGRAVCVKDRLILYMLGKMCSATADCVDPGLICFRGRCKCTPGFSFNYAGETCVRNCKAYGPQMTIYRGLDMMYHNTLALTTSSLKFCIAQCIREETFVCLSMEFSKSQRKCNLSKRGYLDIAKSLRHKGDMAWTLGTRNCA
ncbi:uncharacterized protein [Haliotis asinina]|uniref:uncharacterized protein n=1 Tax=Haliotis asinina TaxID=109174 RepID=UPI00353276EE